jgi:transposase InsO family protein
MKRGLPRSGYHDNGGAMTAEEIREGLTRLGITDARTLSFSAYMNGKIEVLWTSVEGQLLAMLENVRDLTLEALNEATQAWSEYQYNRAVHSETGQTPLARFLAGPDLQRPQSGQRGSAAGLYPHPAAYPALERWYGGDRGAPL